MKETCIAAHCKCMYKECPNHHYADCEVFNNPTPTCCEKCYESGGSFGEPRCELKDCPCHLPVPEKKECPCGMHGMMKDDKKHAFEDCPHHKEKPAPPANGDWEKEFPWLDPKLGSAVISAEDKIHLINFIASHREAYRKRIVEELGKMKRTESRPNSRYNENVIFNTALSKVKAFITNLK